MSSVRIGDLVQFQRGVSWSANQEHSEPGPGRIPVLRIPNIQEQLNTRDLVYLSGVSEGTRKRTAASNGWLLLVGSNGNPERIGNAVLIDEDDEYLFASFLVGLKPDALRVYDRYLLRLLMSESVRLHLRITVRGSTGLQNINLPALANFQVALPPLPIQRRVSEILDTVDDQIRATEQIIAKLLYAKQGLLIDLLTHGISGAGQRRNAVACPHDFTDSPFGLIPRNWQVKPLEDLLSPVDPAMRSGPFGSALLKHELVPRGIPMLGIDNVHVDRFIPHYQRFVTPEKAQELARYRVRPRDVMITIMGTVGRACLVPDDMGEALSSKHVWTMSFDEERYLPYLVSLQLNHSPWARTHLRKDEQGGIMSAIRSDTLRSLPLPVPPIEEQRNIAAVLLEADRRIADEKAELAKLVLVKTGASTDLLTGRVRVPVEATA